MNKPGSVRAARTRAALLSAGLDLLVDRPVDGIAIDELVAVAGVGKGSFFNHFEDKQCFADAVGSQVRAEIEAWVAHANLGVTSPLHRLTGGMIAACRYAQIYPQRTLVLARTSRIMTPEDHPLNRQLLTDLEGVVAEGLADLPSLAIGVTFWLGCCHGVMAKLVERPADLADAATLVAEMLEMGLRGLGVPDHQIDAIAAPDAVLARLAMASEGQGSEGQPSGGQGPHGHDTD